MSLNRVAIFAHYDENDEIQDYVIFYLKELQKISDKIIFVSDSNIQNEELIKIKPYIINSIVGKHGEYDFGSYKKGFLYAKENDLLKNCDELIFANDSCYAPLFPFEEMFSKMSKLDVDFWGTTENFEKCSHMPAPIRHIQSYFIVFKPNIFNNNIFNNFITTIKKENTKEEIIAKYEIGLTDLLVNKGFKFDSYCNISKVNIGAFIYKYNDLIKQDKNPFLKRTIALNKNQNIYPIFLNFLIFIYTNYDYNLIKKDQKKYKSDVSLAFKLGAIIYELKKIRQRIIKIHINKKEQKIYLFRKVILGIFEEKNNICLLKIFWIKIKFKNIIKQNKEKDIILNSGFWDAKWYIAKYHPNFNSKKALNYWYSKGWRNGELPSKYFNENYVDFCKILDCNPVLQYINKGQRCFPSNYNPYKSDKDIVRIEEYLNYKPTRKAKGVVYTCITNDYDDIREIEIYKYIDKDWDYVCFTDNQNDIKQGQIGIWEIRPLQFSELDNTRNQRWHKTNPHILFPEFEQSCWIDGNINILSDTLFKNIYDRNQDLLVTKHFKNTCIFKEYEDVLNADLDDENLIKEEKEIVIKADMPKNWGMPETNVLYRKHNKINIVNFDNEWWKIIEKYSKRDQLSAPYLMWKYGFENCFIENSRIEVYDYYVFAHKKGRDK